MANNFIKTVTTQTVAHKENANGPCGIIMSTKPTQKGEIQLVIGASFDKRSCCYINTRGLRDLAKQLIEIADVMDEEVFGF